MSVSVQTIPSSMRAVSRWICYRLVQDCDRLRKLPVDPRAGKTFVEGSNWTKDSTRWSSFEEAIACSQQPGVDGVGFVVGDGWVYVDKDKCIANGALSADAKRLLIEVGSYAETSVSGTGIKIVCRGPARNTDPKDRAIEIQADGGFTTITGNHIPGTPTTVEDRAIELRCLMDGKPSPRYLAHLLAQHWLPNGATTQQHDSALAVGGYLARRGYGPKEVEEIVLDAAHAANDENPADRARGAADSARKLAAGDQAVTGGPRLAEILGQPCLSALDAYLGNADVRVDDIEVVSPNELDRAVTPPYHFDPAFAPDHFVSQWIEFFSGQCDAALEFFEATALMALSLATHAMRVHLSGAAEPLRTNLYMALVGNAAASRKTTTKDLLLKVVRSIPFAVGVLPEMSSHEGTVEALSIQSGKSALWSIDELKPQLEKLTHAQHLSGLLGLILTLYSATSYTYQRVSKRRGKKGGEDPEEDAFHVGDVTFSIIGCCTPTIFEKLTTEAVESGLLPRFAIIWPSGKPERKARFQLVETEQEPTALIKRLGLIAKHVERCAVKFDDGVLDQLDQEIDLPIEEGTDSLMLKRMGVMAQKVAMLSAAGRYTEGLDRFMQPDLIVVTEEDARSAIAVVQRWIRYSRAFEARLNESQFERTLQKCLELVRGRHGHVSRREIARRVHVPAKDLREIEATLMQRGQIEVVQQKKAMGAPAFFWKWTEE